jgi:hypothetical protein
MGSGSGHQILQNPEGDSEEGGEMKLKDTKQSSMDLTEKEKKHRWAKEILSLVPVKIPIMTSIAKKTESAHFNFIGLGRHTSLAEALIFKSKRFRTTSEVYRAAMYIGMSVLYHLTEDEGTVKQKARANQIYQTIELLESLNHDRQSIDAVVWSAKDMIECADSGVIDYDEMQEKVTMLIETLPKELRKVAHHKIKRVMKGDSVVDIMETKVQRGTKKTKRRRV